MTHSSSRRDALVRVIEALHAEIAALNYAVELRSWMAAPDPEQQRLRGIALYSLRAAERGSRRSPPTCMPFTPWSQPDVSADDLPLMTSPLPRRKENGFPLVFESKMEPFISLPT